MRGAIRPAPLPAWTQRTYCALEASGRVLPSLSPAARWLSNDCPKRRETPWKKLDRPQRDHIDVMWKDDRRSFSTSSGSLKDERNPPNSSPESNHPSTSPLSDAASIINAEPPPPSPVTKTTSGPLPFSTTTLLDNISSLTHRLNTLTGTDYTPITRLRSSISTQEAHLSSLFTILAEAKTTHVSALNKRTASQKEVVQLLERKHSWSATDLERYMSLIRSEHVDDKAVTEAQDLLQAREKDLEEGRQTLERLERELYHEEQVWSDTIRRNSTWVTVGLMGLNVGLLVASLVLIEPWRRRRLVKEIRGALDEKVAGNQEMARKGDTLKSVEQGEPEEAIDQLMSTTAEVEIPPTITAAAPTVATEAVLEEPMTDTSSTSLLHAPTDGKTGTWELYKAYWADLLSERRITMRRKDLTATAVEGAAAGAALMGLLFVLLRPR
ncbi:MAG: sensitivity to high expression protein she9 [Chrysothrix sp. TS-e1954]|nr:MAG: sensitivity to high expression protein she9 [Chrysothrix sp. TS-e1954]